MKFCRVRPSGAKDGIVLKRMALIGGLGFAALTAGTAQAVDGLWVGAGAEWTVGGNWSSSPQVPDGIAAFTNNGAPTAVTISSSASIDTMDFTALAPVYTFTVRNGASFSVNSAINANLETVPNFAVDTGSTLTFGDGGFASIGTLADGPSGGGRLVIGPTAPFTLLSIEGADSTVFSGSISGAGSLELANATLTLTGASNGGIIGTIGGDLTVCNCFGGGLTIDGGALTVSGLSTGVFVAGGTLSVINGGTLQDNLDLLVSSAMVISGPGSSVTVAGATGVGVFARGTLTISNGGTLNSRGGAEIDALFDTPSVMVTGAGSTWNVGGFGLAVGGGSTGGPGTLSIADGAKVNVDGIVGIGDQGPGTSMVTVTGAGSNLTATSSLFIGGILSTIGTLTVADGGAVNSPGPTVIGQGSTLNLGAGGLSGAIVTPYIVNAGAIVANFTDTLTLSANIFGPGTLSKAGAGTLALTGINVFGGGITVTGGLVNFSTAANLGAGAVTLNGGGLQWAAGNTTDVSAQIVIGPAGATFDTNGNNVSLASALPGLGGLTKIGSGVLGLTGASTYSGPTMVNAGTLSVTGSLASTVTVNGGGTLGGTGTVGGLVNSGGTVAPGNSIGTLTVGGNYVQNGGIYQVETNTAGQSDRLNVTGSATLNGGTVQVLAQPGARNVTYTILTATGGVTGTYAGAADNFIFLAPSLGYDANNVYLTLQSAFAAGALTPNQYAVGTALDRAANITTGDFNDVLNALVVLNAQQGPAALNAISGQQYADFGTMNVQGAALFMNAVGQQMALARGASGAGQRVALAQACTTEACDGASPWSAWVSALGGLGAVAGNGNSSTLTYNFGGVAAGVDYRVDPRIVLGLGVGYAAGNQWVDSFQGRGWTDTVSVIGYGSFSQSGFYADVLAGYAWSGNQLQRQITIPGLQPRTASGSTGANQFLGQIETGYRIGLFAPAAASLTPFARLQGSTVTQNAFSEWGANSLSLTVAQQTTNSLRTLFGADLAGKIGLGDDRTLDLGLRLGWLHEFADTGRPITAAFAGAPANGFTVWGATPQRDAAVIGFTAGTAIAQSTSIYLRYDGEIGTGNDNHMLNAGVRFSW